MKRVFVAVMAVLTVVLLVGAVSPTSAQKKKDKKAATESTGSAQNKGQETNTAERIARIEAAIKQGGGLGCPKGFRLEECKDYGTGVFSLIVSEYHKLVKEEYSKATSGGTPDYSKVVRVYQEFIVTYIKFPELSSKAMAGLTELIGKSGIITQGNIFFEKKDYDLAITFYNHVIGLDSNNADAYAARSRVYFQKGDNAKAIADAEAALKINSDNAIAKEVLVAIEQQEQQAREAQEAREAEERKAQAEKAEAQKLADRARANLQKGNAKAALADAEAAYKLDNKNATAIEVASKVRINAKWAGFKRATAFTWDDNLARQKAMREGMPVPEWWVSASGVSMPETPEESRLYGNTSAGKADNARTEREAQGRRDQISGQYQDCMRKCDREFQACLINSTVSKAQCKLDAENCERPCKIFHGR